MDTRRGRPPKDGPLLDRVIRVRVDVPTAEHVRRQGGSAFVRELIEADMGRVPKRRSLPVCQEEGR
jgi:hypothetical protein